MPVYAMRTCEWGHLSPHRQSVPLGGYFLRRLRVWKQQPLHASWRSLQLDSRCDLPPPLQAAIAGGIGQLQNQRGIVTIETLQESEYDTGNFIVIKYTYTALVLLPEPTGRQPALPLLVKAITETIELSKFVLIRTLPFSTSPVPTLAI